MALPDLAILRSRFAERALAKAGVKNPRLSAAFAAVPREKFLGRGPWRIAKSGGYHLTATDRPAEVYVDEVIALDSERAINNGEPSGHVLWINALELKAGERVDHIGAGAGYYSAILAELVGTDGFVEAYEIDPELAARACEALRDRPNVRVHSVSGASGELPEADAVYVNAGASAPPPTWLDALKDGGRLVFPLTGAGGMSGMFKISRTGADRWPARMISGAAFIGLCGGHAPGDDRATAAAFRSGGAAQVRWFVRDRRSEDGDWLRGDGWRLTR